MLDTDTVSFAVRGMGGVAARIVEQQPSELCVSALTLAELRRGVERRKSHKLDRVVSAFFKNISVLPFDEECARAFGRLSAQLEARGTPIAAFDALIAAHAVTLGVTLVTNNARHFSRVPALRIANWF
ncbi:MAG TPA: type II toxin-antitoxin system VapC family toxin [Thermoanaerobaculia bacterium]|jgi:tRNA(fMet)-specific endonuclease VapC